MTIKLKILPQFPSSVTATGPILLNKTGGNYAFSFDVNAIGIPAASNAPPVMDGAAISGVSPNFSRADHVHPADTSRAPLASPTFTGTPAAPTAAVDTNTTQIASTAFVLAQAASATPLIDGVAAVGTATKYAREDHKHPTDTTLAPKASPTFSGTLTSGGPAVVSDTTASTSTVTGALKVAGGLGVAGDINWGGAASAAYTPTVTASTGTITAYTATGLFKKIGKLVYFSVVVTMTTPGTGSGRMVVTLPSSARGAGAGFAAGFANSATKTCTGTIFDNAAAMSILISDGTFPTAGGVNYFAGTYEEA